MAPAEDPRTPEGTARDSQSSPGRSALHGPRPLGSQARGPGVFRERPGWAALHLGLPIARSLSLNRLGSAHRGSPACSWSWRSWALRSAGRDRQTPEEAPSPLCGPPTGRADPGTGRGSCAVGARGPSDTAIIHLQRVIFSPSVLFEPIKAWPQTAGDKAAAASPCGSKNGDPDMRTEADGHRQGRAGAQRGGAKGPGPPRLRRQAGHCAREPRSRGLGTGGTGGTGAPFSLPSPPSPPLPHRRPRPGPWL